MKDRQSAQKRISDSRASRTSDQIVKDRQSAQKRISDSRASRTSDQIVKDRQVLRNAYLIVVLDELVIKL